ncbi:hypothetical protein WH47_01972 [Habropoda laboriosa]|uniref:Uncharacterized protein n=1 Tax=Habropoda laboriosa TaxID=597456 RepID=A0A0L7R086_9HYME|nr:hypothetical protein WH47_01972 [Habropoda laboriosa]
MACLPLLSAQRQVPAYHVARRSGEFPRPSERINFHRDIASTLLWNRLVSDFATDNDLKHNFSKDAKMAGMEWYYSFMAGHPQISLRRPEATSLNRTTAFNPVEINIFNNHNELMSKYRFQSESEGSETTAELECLSPGAGNPSCDIGVPHPALGGRWQ